MQAVRFVAVWVFASGIGSWRGGLFCHGAGFCKRCWVRAGRVGLSWGGFPPVAVVRGCVCGSGRFAAVQAVWFVAVLVFASGSGFVQGCFFCGRVGFPQGQLYAAVFVVRIGLWPCKPFGLSRCFFLHTVLVSGGAVCFVMGGVAWVFAGRFVLSRRFFLHAVLVPGGAVCFVRGRVVWVFAGLFVLSGGGLCGFLRGGLFCRGVFFCTRYWFLAGLFVLSGCALHGFFLRKLVVLGSCLLSIFVYKTQSVASNARIACKTIKSTHSPKLYTLVYKIA